jgi:hypothetical protein
MSLSLLLQNIHSIHTHKHRINTYIYDINVHTYSVPWGSFRTPRSQKHLDGVTTSIHWKLNNIFSTFIRTFLLQFLCSRKITFSVCSETYSHDVRHTWKKNIVISILFYKTRCVKLQRKSGQCTVGNCTGSMREECRVGCGNKSHPTVSIIMLKLIQRFVKKNYILYLQFKLKALQFGTLRRNLRIVC